MLSHYLLLILFAGVVVAIPTLWLVLGLKTYGTGDYYQP